MTDINLCRIMLPSTGLTKYGTGLGPEASDIGSIGLHILQISTQSSTCGGISNAAFVRCFPTLLPINRSQNTLDNVWRVVYKLPGIHWTKGCSVLWLLACQLEWRPVSLLRDGIQSTRVENFAIRKIFEAN